MKLAGIAVTSVVLMIVVHGRAFGALNVDKEPHGIYVPDIGAAWTTDTLKEASAEGYLEKIVGSQDADTTKQRARRTGLAGKSAAQPNRASNESQPRRSDAESIFGSVSPGLAGGLAGGGLAVFLVGLLVLRWRRRAHRAHVFQAGLDYQPAAGPAPRPALASGLVQHHMNGQKASGSEQKAALNRRAA